MKNKGLLFGILIFTLIITTTVFSASADEVNDETYNCVCLAIQRLERKLCCMEM